MLTFSYARREIALILIVGTAATAAAGYFLGWWGVLPALTAAGLLSFYRHPRRATPPGEDIVVAPADGKVVEIARHACGADGVGPVLRIMIFLRIHDVHVNRSPCAGRVADVTYRPGRFLNALRPEADVQNECNTVALEPDAPLPGPVHVRQIAGILARRIVCIARAGQRLAAGEPFGMIKLGSRTEVCLPENSRWEVAARVGQKVLAGRTVLARLRPEAAAGEAADD